jgi:dolichol-phosphate mannosyltransferase
VRPEDRVLIFTATYNEAGNIADWILRTQKSVPGSHILIVDDNSPDGTAEVVKATLKDGMNIELLVRGGKEGLASAHMLAMRYALEHGYDTLITLDADLSHLPEEIGLLIGADSNLDFVIGTRFGKSQHHTESRKRLVSIIGNSLAQKMIPTGMTEYTTSMRRFNRPAMNVILSQPKLNEGYSFFMECVYLIHEAGLTMGEVPINFLDRRHGKSKIPRGQIYESIRVLTQLTIRRKFGHKERT